QPHIDHPHPGEFLLVAGERRPPALGRHRNGDRVSAARDDVTVDGDGLLDRPLAGVVAVVGFTVAIAGHRDAGTGHGEHQRGADRHQASLETLPGRHEKTPSQGDTSSAYSTRLDFQAPSTTSKVMVPR